MSSPPDFKISTDYYVYHPKEQGVYPIPESEWTRLKRSIKRIIPGKRWFEVIASIFFGIFASSVLSIIAFQSAKELASWVLPTTWAFLAVSFILGIAFIILDSKQKELIKVSVESVIEEMGQIEQNFHIPQNKHSIDAQEKVLSGNRT